jgi:hypothetical protein
MEILEVAVEWLELLLPGQEAVVSYFVRIGGFYVILSPRLVILCDNILKYKITTYFNILSNSTYTIVLPLETV